jgi:hypothetical protein
MEKRLLELEEAIFATKLSATEIKFRWMLKTHVERSRD